jgi:hypothetical protein
MGAESLSVYWNGRGSANGVNEENDLAEVTNRPGMQQFHLGPKGGGMDRVLIKSSGKWQDHNSETVGTSQQYSTSPSTVVYGTLFASTPTTTTAPTIVIQVDHYFDIVAERIDATTS